MYIVTVLFLASVSISFHTICNNPFPPSRNVYNFYKTKCTYKWIPLLDRQTTVTKGITLQCIFITDTSTAWCAELPDQIIIFCLKHLRSYVYYDIIRMLGTTDSLKTGHSYCKGSGETCPLTTNLTAKHTLKDVSNREVPTQCCRW
jgi:hypothetical protein